MINKGSGPKGGRYLHCSNSNLKSTCSSTPWKYDDFERDFFIYIKEVDLASIISEGSDARVRANLENERAVNDEQKRELRSRSDTLLERLDDPELTKPVFSEMSKLLGIRLGEIEKLESRNVQIEQFLTDLTLQTVSSSQDAAKLYFSDVINEEDPAELDKLRRKIHFGLRNSIEIIEVDSMPQLYVPVMTIRSLEPRVRFILANAGYNSDDDIDAFLDTKKGAKFLAETSRSFKVVFKNGAVRQVWPGKAHNISVISQKHVAFLRRMKDKANL